MMPVWLTLANNIGQLQLKSILQLKWWDVYQYMVLIENGCFISFFKYALENEMNKELFWCKLISLKLESSQGNYFNNSNRKFKRTDVIDLGI